MRSINVKLIMKIAFVNMKTDELFTEVYIRKDKNNFYSLTSATGNYCCFCESSWVNGGDDNICPICNNEPASRVVDESFLIDLFNEYVSDNDLRIYINGKIFKKEGK